MSRRLAMPLALALVAALGIPPVHAAEPSAATSLEDLLRQVREGNAAQRQADARREAEFRGAKDRQKALLTEALRKKAAAEKRSAELEAEFAANEADIPHLQEELDLKLGTLGELFGVVRQVAGETLALVQGSLVSAQLPGREQFLRELAKRKELPSAADLERLWYVLQEEMTQSGEVTRFDADVVGADGESRETEVIRVGPFNAVAGGRYLQWLPETRQLVEPASQPAGRHLATLEGLADAKDGVVGVSIDPSRGSILSLLIQRPTLAERIRQGGVVGYVIIALGLAGLLLAAQRLLYLAGVTRKVQAQRGAAEARDDNPLGRVIAVWEHNRAASVETLELKLDEAILRETPALERGNALIKVLSVVAPLLGLLGTVTGMIRTFQAITLFGTGDPKLMAGGISEALVTTVLGLMVAIPLLLLHAIVSARSRALVQVLDEQAAGIVAEHAEGLEGRGNALAG